MITLMCILLSCAVAEELPLDCNAEDHIPARIEPKPGVQEVFSELVAEFQRLRKMEGSISENEGKELLKRWENKCRMLPERAPYDVETLIVQYIYFISTPKPEFEPIDEVLAIYMYAPGMFMQHVEPSKIIDVLAPYRYTTTGKTRKNLDKALRGSLVREEDEPWISYQSYLEYKRNEEKEIPCGFISFIYEIHPIRAMSAVAEKLDKKSVLEPVLSKAATHLTPLHRQGAFSVSEEEVTSGVRNTLVTLAQHELWWVKLCAAELVTQIPQLRITKVMKVLKKSQHVLVKRALARIPQVDEQIEEIKSW